MFIFFTFIACTLLLFVAGLQIWLSMNNSIPTQKKTDKKPVLLSRYQFLLIGLLFLFLLLGSCITSYDSIMENRPAQFCQNRSNGDNTTDRNISKDSESIDPIIQSPINITKIISPANPQTIKIIKRDTCIQQVAGNNNLGQNINLYSKECHPSQPIVLFPNNYCRLFFQCLIGLVCLILLLLLIACFRVSLFSSSAKYKYKYKAKMSKYERDIEIKKLSEREAFYRGYYSSINSKD